MIFKLNKIQADEVYHKIDILSTEKELCESYGVSQKEAEWLLDTIPSNGGEWIVPDGKLLEAVQGEMLNCNHILEDQIWDAEQYLHHAIITTDIRGNTLQHTSHKSQIKAAKRLANSLRKIFKLNN